MEAILKQASELEDCQEGKKVVLFFDKGEQYEGIFNGMDEDTIMLQSNTSKNIIGLPISRLVNYFEEA